MKRADKLNARFVGIYGEDGRARVAILRDMATGDQSEIFGKRRKKHYGFNAESLKMSILENLERVSAAS